MSRRATALIALLWLASGCSPEVWTETVVIIDAEPAVKGRADHTTLVVTKSPQTDAIEVHSDARAPRRASFPYVIALTPGDTPIDSLYRLEVTALEDGKALATARLISGYVTNQRRYVRLWLEDACIGGPECSPDQTCHLGVCVDARVDVQKLTDDRGSPVDSTAAIAGAQSPPTAGGAAAGGGAPGGADAPATDTSPVESLDVSTHHACVRKMSGSVICWGLNDHGQLGNGTTQASSTPVKVKGLTDAVELAVADGFTCARRAGGEAACWGANDSGQLGNGTTQDASTPVTVVGIADAVQIVTDSTATCVRGRDNTVRCWGANNFGQLGNGTKESSSTPMPVKDLAGVTQLAGGSLLTCARTLVASVLCWGSNVFGGLGRSQFSGPTPGGASTTPLSLFQGGVSELFPGASCARQSGNIMCWGDGWGIEGEDWTDQLARTSMPFQAKSLAGATQIATVGSDGCALKASGNVVCWGRNVTGRVGDGTTEGVATPVSVGGLSGVKSIAVSSAVSCALKSGGAVYCWGANGQGQLGAGPGENSTVPVRVQGL